MPEFGFSEKEARAFLMRELDKTASSTSFYWESDELEEALELLVDALAKLVVANNHRFRDDAEREAKRHLSSL